MAGPTRPPDTTVEVQARLIARWRSMTVAERAELVRKMCEDVELLARADIVTRTPQATEAEITRELARRRYGAAAADIVGERSRKR
jgi:hypothetical protein